MIPRIIHQFWDLRAVPPSVEALMRTWKDKNPEFEHKLWNDWTAGDFILEHFGWEANVCFRACKVPAMRADVFRCAVLYVEGGVYVDADEECTLPIADLLPAGRDVMLYRLRNADRDTFRIRTDFMAARPRTAFFGHLVGQILENVRNGASNNIYEVTGPGAVTRVFQRLPMFHKTWSIEIVDRGVMADYAAIHTEIDYKANGAHWSSVQKELQIIDWEKLSERPLPAFRWVDTLFIGHAACGGEALGKALRRGGADVRSREVGADGMVSWWHTAFLATRGAVRYTHEAGRGVARRCFVGSVVHYLRDPRTALAAIIMERMAGRSAAFAVCRNKIREKFGIDLAALSPEVAAATSYALWNDIAASLADQQVLTEQPDLRFLFPWLRVDVLPGSRLDDVKLAHKRPEIDFAATVRQMPEEARQSMQRYVDLYDDFKRSVAERRPSAGRAQRWSPEGYAQNARFVSEKGATILSWLAPQAEERILDIGCGDGALTAEIAAAGATVVGIDASEPFVEAARARGLDARPMDAEAIHLDDAPFDAAFSNAALHWMRRPEAVARGVARVLKPGGRFVGEMGGHGNVAAIVTALMALAARHGLDRDLADPWYFPTLEAYRAVLEGAGFTVERIELVPRPTPLPTGIRGWLRTFRTPLFESAGEAAEALLEEAEALLAPSLRDEAGGWTADYVRLRFFARRAL